MLLAVKVIFPVFALQAVSWRAYAWVLGGFVGVKLFLLACIGIVYLTLSLFNIHSENLSGPDFSEETWHYSLWASVVVAPVREELIFRGLVLQGLLRRYSPWL